MSPLKKQFREVVTTSTVFHKGRNRQVIVALEPPCLITLRLKGLRQRYKITADDAYWHAIKQEAAFEQSQTTKRKR